MNVYLYSFTGKYKGNAQYDYEHPELNSVQSCTLFLAQEEDDAKFEQAMVEIGKYGFDEITGLKGYELNIETLSSDSYDHFIGFYKKALSDGHTLVYNRS